MRYDWQTLAALLVVLLAVAYVLRQTFRTLFGKKSACGSCGNCSRPVAALPEDPRRISLL